jgi:hypothetical protein
MKNDSPKNFNCEFAPEIIDFLYGELSGERKNAFNLHLRNCSDCADEIEDFSGIRYSIRDWKVAEFDNLATPKIEIPYEIAAVRTVETEKLSWFDSIRNYLTFAPVLSGAAAVLIFAVLIATGIFFLNKNAGEDLVAGSNQKPNAAPSVKPQPSVKDKIETDEKTPEIVDIPEKAIDDNIIDKKQRNIETIPAQVKNNSNAKQKTSPVKTVEKKSSSADLKNDTKNAKTVPNRNRPRLNELPEEDEDNSLRLADLFAELETKE